MITTILVNGDVSEGRIPVTDSSVLRGDGCFEVLKCYDGRPFALDEHLDRLERSASALEIELPRRDDLEAWVTAICDELVDGAVRIVVTRGATVPGVDDQSNVIVFGHPSDAPSEPARLHPLAAPWHSAGVEWALSGVKFLSYAPNLSATRVAVNAGYDDALLLTTDGVMLGDSGAGTRDPRLDYTPCRARSRRRIRYRGRRGQIRHGSARRGQ